MSFALIVGAFFLLLLLLGVFVYRHQQAVPIDAATRRPAARKYGDMESEEDEEYDDEMNVRSRQRGTREVAGGLRRRQTQRSEQNGDGGAGDEEETAPRQKLSRLQKKKLEKERDREERRQAQEAEESSRRTRREAERQRYEDHEREEAERLLEEEKALQELREEKKRQDDEEYAKWVGAIGVEERGEIGDEEQRQQEALRTFLTEQAREMDAREENQQNEKENTGQSSSNEKEDESIKRNILVLSDVAREYGVTVEVLVKLIETLVADGVISGVFDDRGKFIFVAESHYRKIALFIQQRGRVSVKELVRECNRVILA